MTDTLLTSLRERMLDETEPLAGLLRKCLVLGAETRSESLRQWARYELNGYDDSAELPSYRILPSPVIMVDYISGNAYGTNHAYDRLQLPAKAQKYVSETLSWCQPIDELEKFAAQKNLSFTGTGLAAAQSIWNKELGWAQQITGMRFSVAGSAIAGMLGQIRTQLVDIVADLTADTPLTELPGKEAVDAAVGTHIGTQYNTTITAPSGPTAVGTAATASTEGLTVDDAIALLAAVRDASAEVGDVAARGELQAAVEELRGAIESATPDAGEVMRKAGKLKAIAEEAVA